MANFVTKIGKLHIKLMTLLVRLLEKLKIQKFLNYNISINIENTVFKIPLRGRIGLENVNLRESWFSTIAGKLIEKTNPADLFVDVGMNVGQTLLKIKAIDKNIHYIGFEPNSACISYVYDLLKLNPFPNVSVHPLGLSSNNEQISLYADNLHASGASVIENFRKSKNIAYVMNISVVKGDDFFINQDRNIGIIKIDVEGF